MPGARLNDVVAVIAGGGRGLGRVFASRLAAQGAAVGLIARSKDQLQETAASLGAQTRTAVAVADVTSEEQLQEAVGELERALGPTDLLVNNAGVLGDPGFAWEGDPEVWWRAMEVNVRGVYNGCRVVVPGMISRGGGRIVNITSNAGLHRWPTMSAYSVSKAAVVKFSENLALECKSSGIKVWGMHPGLTAFGLTTAPRFKAPDAEAANAIESWVQREVDAGHVIEPSVGAALLVRLAAGDADALSGCHLTVHDDLDALVARSDEVMAQHLQTLRIKSPEWNSGADHA